MRGNDSFYAPEKLIDDDKNSYWATDDAMTTSSFDVDLGSEQDFNVIKLEELISLGQRIQQYKIDVSGAADAGAWRNVVQQTTIGYKKLDRFPKVTASKIRVT